MAAVIESEQATSQRRVAVVTHAASVIGSAIALRLSRDGIAVGVVDDDELAAEGIAATIVDAGGDAIGVGAAIEDARDVRVALSRIAYALGKPSVLISNVGGVRRQPFADLTELDWNEVTLARLRAAFNLARTIRPYLVDHGWGRIVNLSYEPETGSAGRASHSTVRGGLHGLIRGLAVELGPVGVTANTVVYAHVDASEDSETAPGARAGSIPVGHSGRPDDIAEAVSYLVSERASFVTGQILHVTGGAELAPDTI